MGEWTGQWNTLREAPPWRGWAEHEATTSGPSEAAPLFNSNRHSSGCDDFLLDISKSSCDSNSLQEIKMRRWLWTTEHEAEPERHEDARELAALVIVCSSDGAAGVFLGDRHQLPPLRHLCFLGDVCHTSWPKTLPSVSV